MPLPGRLVGAATDALFGFFGRGSELAGLDEARKQAHSTKRCHAVFVAGEAGMGKTALVAQVARTAHDDGAVVLFGRADEDFGIAYQPWIEAVSTLVRDGDPEFVAGLPAAQRTALGRLVPAVRTMCGWRIPIRNGCCCWRRERAPRDRFPTAPVLVVLDDVHWADTASLQVLRHVMASTTPMDVTIACTYRDTDLARGDALPSCSPICIAKPTSFGSRSPGWKTTRWSSCWRRSWPRARRRRCRARARAASRDRRQPVLHRRDVAAPGRVRRHRLR